MPFGTPKPTIKWVGGLRLSTKSCVVIKIRNFKSLINELDALPEDFKNKNVQTYGTPRSTIQDNYENGYALIRYVINQMVIIVSNIKLFDQGTPYFDITLYFSCYFNLLCFHFISPLVVCILFSRFVNNFQK
jgi:hypothetical protein